MSKALRKVIFWTHLAIGLAAGIIIAVMCFTGALLAFEKEIVAWAERDVRRVTQGSTKIPLEDLISQSNIKGASVTVFADPTLAVQMSQGRTNTVYVNPYTGESKAQSAPKLRAFLQSMIEWHRYLAMSGDSRPRGKSITGAANVVFLLLAVSGIYLWWPRVWSNLRAVAMPSVSLRGKARDWNWHNSIGIWSAGVLIVLTATALPISYKAVGDRLYKAQPPGDRGSGATSLPVTEGKALPLSALVEAAFKEFPGAAQMTLRSAGKGPVNISVKDPNAPRFVQTQVTFDPVTGAVLKKEGYEQFPAGRKVRSWTRFLHTGEALGPIGQFVAGLACVGGLVLVWTGFALAIRRFFGPRA